MDAVTEKKKYHNYNRYERGWGPTAALTERQLDYLQFIFEVGPARTSAVHAYICPTTQKQNTTNALKLLNRRPNAYLDKPEEQNERKHVDYVDLRYSINIKGAKKLLENGRISELQLSIFARLHARGTARPFWHDALGADYLSSLRLGIKADPTLIFLSRYDILAAAPESTRIAKDPFLIKLPSGKTVSPDDISGIGRVRPDASIVYRYYPREDHTGSQPNRRITSKGSSYAEKMPKYQEALETGALKAHFGIKTAPVVVTTVTVSKDTSHAFRRHLKRMEGSWRDHLAFFAEPSFNRNHKELPPDCRAFTEPYLRAAADPHFINSI